MLEPVVRAAVTGQPALPMLPLTSRRPRAFGMPRAQFDLAVQRAATDAPLMGLRFSNDSVCPSQRFDELKLRLGPAFLRVEIDSARGNAVGINPRAHPVLTGDFVDKPQYPTRQALYQVLDFLGKNLGKHGPQPPLGRTIAAA